MVDFFFPLYILWNIMMYLGAGSLVVISNYILMQWLTHGGHTLQLWYLLFWCLHIMGIMHFWAIHSVCVPWFLSSDRHVFLFFFFCNISLFNFLLYRRIPELLLTFDSIILDETLTRKEKQKWCQALIWNLYLDFLYCTPIEPHGLRTLVVHVSVAPKNEPVTCQVFGRLF